MKGLQDFQPSQLVNLLARETISYYKLIGDDASVEECTQCNDKIRQIEMELNSRRDPMKEIFSIGSTKLDHLNIRFK